jgi:hypothetical protein
MTTTGAFAGDWSMGYNARNDEIRDNVTRCNVWEAQRGAPH